jgi:hypothetical protein
MSRQRRNPVQLAPASGGVQHLSELFHEPLPSTLLGQLCYHLRVLFHLIRHILYCFIFGLDYDLTSEERETRLAHRRQQHRAHHSEHHDQEKGQDALRLGYIRSTYELRWRPGSPSVTFWGDVVDGEHDPFAHAVTAYAHCGLDPPPVNSTSRIVAYTGPSAATATLSSDEPYAFPTFEHVPYGTLQAFLLSSPSYPSLHHPAIPCRAVQSALPLHWLLNLASAVAFLHSHGVAHCALALDLLWLRADFSIALFDLSCSVFTVYNEDYDEDAPVGGNLPGWGSFPFPIYDVDSTYYSGATPEDAMALGKLIDVFDFGTVAWRLLTRTVEGAPGWAIPKRKAGEPTWNLVELQRRLQEGVDAAGAVTGNGRGRYEPPGMEVVRKCWALEYRNGEEVLEALRTVVLETGLRVQKSDEVEGVAQAVGEFRKDYRPKSYLGNELISKRGYA